MKIYAVGLDVCDVGFGSAAYCADLRCFALCCWQLA